MKIKTSELAGPALDWMTLMALGYSAGHWHRADGQPQVWVENLDAQGNGPAGYFPGDDRFAFSMNWAAGGPIIEREGILVEPFGPAWRAAKADEDNFTQRHYSYRGPTPLIAAMRCFVASKLGDEVDVPEGLL
jgi:Protein of unknown function (DUF2591)